MDFSSLILTAYIICETIRANYTYFALQRYPSLTPSLVAFLSELFKLLIASTAIFTSKPSFEAISKTIRAGEYNKIVPYAIPAVLYLTNNIIYFIVLPLTSPSLLQVCILAKLPTTAIMHNFMIRRQPNRWAWTSLSFLCVGLVIFNIPRAGEPAAGTDNWLVAPVAGLVIAILSGLASIYGETLTKKGNFWESQAYLYMWGVILALISFPLTASLSVPKSVQAEATNNSGGFAAVMVAGVLVILTAGVGMIVAIILRRGDNLLKMVGTSASLITIGASQFVIMPELRATNFTPSKIWGGGLVAVSTWCYNHYKEQPWPEFEKVRQHNDEELLRNPHLLSSSAEAEAVSDTDYLANESDPKNPAVPATEKSVRSSWWTPNWMKVLGMMIIVSFASADVARRETYSG
ncbi:MAG: hypothetical protein M1818_007273 [Claussenomyces sp. TS43310]|nr:MAG: hypothetical protein M1818_007273 [Claussenomyces sp. TS43310]